MNRLDAFRVTLSGVHLVEASAGTGKTHAITTLYLRAVVERGLLPEQILVVTFTRAATGELRERIRARLRMAERCLEQPESPPDPELAQYLAGLPSPALCLARLTAAMLVIDQAAVMTIHGFCARVLEQNAFESKMPFGPEVVESVDTLVDEVVNDFLTTRFANQSEARILALRSIGFGAASLRILAELALRRDDYVFEPSIVANESEIEQQLGELEQQRKLALEWLEQQDSLPILAGINKTKTKGPLGKRLSGYVEKARAWLTSPVHSLDGTCDAFERLHELAEKNPVSKTSQLLEWFASLRAATSAYEDWRRSVLTFAVRLRLEFLTFLKEELEQRKLARGIQTFDDLLARLAVTLHGPSGEGLARALRERFPLGMIDEFQDTDPVQYHVFSQIYQADATLFLIGDPKQSIYAFRGADVDNYLFAKRDPRVNCHTLHVNWRSDPALLEGIERLYGTHPDPFLSAGIDYVPVSARPHAADLSDATGNPISGVELMVLADPSLDAAGKPMPKYRAKAQALDAAVDKVQGLLSLQPRGWGRAVRASDIAVLCRVNRECQLMANALRKSGIRCVQTSDTSVFLSDACLSVVVLLRALLAPGDARNLAALLADELVGCWPVEIERLKGSLSEWDAWVERVTFYRKHWDRSGLLSAMVRLCDELKLRERVFAYALGERYVTDLLHVAELVDSAAKQQRLSAQRQLDWLMRVRSGEEAVCSEEQQLRIEADTDAVLLTTVHRSKGLQFPFVICPFLWDGGGRRPSASVLEFRRPSENAATNRHVLHLEPQLLGEDAIERDWIERERLCENARLLYVALTRAKHQVSIAWVVANASDQSALSHLLFEPRRAVEDCQQLDPASRVLLSRLVDGRTLRLVERGSGAAENQESQSPVDDLNQSTALTSPPELRRVVQASVRTTSYSALTASAPQHGGLGHDGGGRIGRDVDALSFGSALLVGTSEPVVGGGAEVVCASPLMALPNGPRTGEALHEILERSDFERFACHGEAPDIRSILGRFGLDADSHTESVLNGLRAILQVPLDPGNQRLRLANISSSSRRCELEFLMRVRALSVAGLTSTLHPEVTGIDASYAEDVAQLEFDPVTGFLRGFIDLVFEFEGRFYVVDYKSNALGSTLDCYAKERLAAAMRQHHYPVQATIYAAAVDRWLRVVKAEYDYETHFGGVYYLFLRGMHPSLGAENGVFACRPSARGLSAFEAMLEARTP